MGDLSFSYILRQSGWGFNRTKIIDFVEGLESNSSHCWYSENQMECVLFSRALAFHQMPFLMCLSPNNKPAFMLLIMTFLYTVEKDGFVGAALMPVNFTTVCFHSWLSVKLK